ncbi:hypothetical protein Cgig2_014748 [Carnegiea gigantea]|uniref:Uncharacterized protein n=1 Tax=Carnegiea gigantea TaxID=171969 RepID=A0A9Q1QUR1_9CARY|nr:hypothetical protein Cgig2_014748 [Carnegiea gigantea]
MGIADQTLTIGCSVGQNHADAAGFLDDESFGHTRIASPVANDDFAPHLIRVEGVLHTEGHRQDARPTWVHNRVHFPIQRLAGVQGHSGNLLSVAKNHIRREVPVNCARPDGGYPRGEIRDRHGIRAIITRRRRHKHSSGNRTIRPDCNGVQVIRRRYPITTANGDGNDINAIIHRRIKRRKNIGVEATRALPTHLVNSQTGFRGDPFCNPGGIPIHAGLESVPAGGSGGRVGPMPVGVPRRLELDIGWSEFFAHLANALPAFRNGTQVLVGEGAALRPDSGIEDSNDDVGTIVGLRPEATLDAEAQELRGPGGVEPPAAVLKDGEDRGVAAERGRETPENGVVSVEDTGRVVSDELGGVPVVVGRENGWFGGPVDPDYVGSSSSADVMMKVRLRRKKKKRKRFFAIEEGETE